MKRIGIVVSVALFGLVLASAGAGESCPIPAMAVPIRYTRLHQIPTVAPRDEISHKIVTPGGMLLDTPKLVAATDVLAVVARDHDTLCFRLLTFARERHKCELTGVARKESDSAYLFHEDSTVVRFTFLGEHQVTVEAVGDGYLGRCERFGKIERAIYTSNESSD